MPRKQQLKLGLKDFLDIFGDEVASGHRPQGVPMAPPLGVQRVEEASPEAGASAPRGGGVPIPVEAERLEPRRLEPRRQQELTASTTSATSPVSSASSAPPAGIDGDGLCVVCLSSERSHAFVPCGHRCVCKECSLSVMKKSSPTCPLCRSDAVSTLHIFN